MPLPGDGTLSLHGYSLPGDTTLKEPKKGFIIKMSPEILEVLQNGLGHTNNVELQLDKQKGLWVGNKFFPMTHQAENSPHELYLRTATQAKPNAPLKLQANVIGKFTVTRELDSRLESKIRDSMVAAERKKDERQIQILHQPPANPKARGSKANGTTTKKSTKKAGTSAAINSTATTRDRSFSPILPPEEKAYEVYGDPGTRRRLVHCLALQPRDTDQAIKMVAGFDVDQQERQELVKMLRTCAVWRADPGQGPDAKKKWHLLSRTWQEIRPYEWPDLTNEERTKLARECRRNYGILKIPDSDPIWEHVLYRDISSSRLNGAGSSNANGEPKRGITTREVKQKKKAAEASSRKANDPIIYKDERVQPSKPRAEPVSNAGSGTVVRTVVRKPPGSGYTRSKTGSNTPSPPEPADKYSAAPSSLPRKPDFAPLPSHASPQERVPSGSGRLPAKSRESQPSSSSSHTHAAEVKSERDPASSLSFKRKAVRDDEAEMSDRDNRDRDRPKPMPKRRKISDGNVASSSSTPTHQQQRTPSLSNKPTSTLRDVSPHPSASSLRAIKKETSPMPALPPPHSPQPPTRSPLATYKVFTAAQDRVAPPSSSSPRQAQSSRHGPSRSRRRSPYFTSSEDEQETAPQPTSSSRVKNERLPSPDRESVSTPSSSSKPMKPIRPAPDDWPYPDLPFDETELTKLYRRKFNKIYLPLHAKHTQACLEAQRLQDPDEETDSELDFDIKNLEEMKKLRRDVDAAEAELLRIQDAVDWITENEDE